MFSHLMDRTRMKCSSKKWIKQDLSALGRLMISFKLYDCRFMKSDWSPFQSCMSSSKYQWILVRSHSPALTAGSAAWSSGVWSTPCSTSPAGLAARCTSRRASQTRPPPPAYAVWRRVLPNDLSVYWHIHSLRWSRLACRLSLRMQTCEHFLFFWPSGACSICQVSRRSSDNCSIALWVLGLWFFLVVFGMSLVIWRVLFMLIKISGEVDICRQKLAKIWMLSSCERQIHYLMSLPSCTNVYLAARWVG
jgi:hypothetical protein